MSSSTTKAIIAAVIAMTVALAGVSLADEADGAGEEYTVSVSTGGALLPYTTSGGVITMPTAEDVSAYYTVPDGYVLTGWRDIDTGALYTPGSTYTLTSDITVEPYLTVDGYAVTFVVDGVEYVVAVSDEGGYAEVPQEAIDAVAEYESTGYHFDGWLADDGTVCTADEIAAILVEGDATYTASFTAVYTITWIVDGVTVATGDTVSGDAMPQDPVKEHYAFVGWYDSDGVAWSEDYVYDGDTVWTAAWDVEIVSVTFVVGDEEYATVLVEYGGYVVMPALPDGYVQWDFDFTTPITGSVTISAVAAEEAPDTGVYQVQFVVDGEVVATYRSDSVTLPTDPVKDGYVFVGWAIGEEVISDPVSYAYTSDTVLEALFQAEDVVTHIVSLEYADGSSGSLTVVDGEEAVLPELSEGMAWALGDALYEGGAVSEDIVLTEVPATVTVSFAVDGVVYSAYTQTVPYGGQATEPVQFVFPDGYDGWSWDFSTILTSDVTIEAAPIVVEEEPGWLDSTTNQLILIILVLIVIGLAAYIIWRRRLAKAQAAAAGTDDAGSGSDSTGSTETGTVTVSEDAPSVSTLSAQAEPAKTDESESFRTTAKAVRKE